MKEEPKPTTAGECKVGSIVRTPDGRRFVLMSDADFGWYARLWLGEGRYDNQTGPFPIVRSSPIEYLGHDTFNQERYEQEKTQRGSQKNDDPIKGTVG